MGTRGDDLRWELMHLTVLDTTAYKLILGIDYFKPRKGVLDMENMHLTLTKEGISYRLPLKDKIYAMKATSVQNYLAASKQKGEANCIDINEVSTINLEEELE